MLEHGARERFLTSTNVNISFFQVPGHWTGDKHIGYPVSEHNTILCWWPGTSAQAPSVNTALHFSDHVHYFKKRSWVSVDTLDRSWIDTRLILDEHLSWHSITVGWQLNSFLIVSQSQLTLRQLSTDCWLVSIEHRPSISCNVQCLPIKMLIKGIDWEYWSTLNICLTVWLYTWSHFLVCPRCAQWTCSVNILVGKYLQWF